MPTNPDNTVLRNIANARKLLVEAERLLRGEAERLFILADAGAPKGEGGANHQGNTRENIATGLGHLLNQFDSTTGYIKAALTRYDRIV